MIPIPASDAPIALDSLAHKIRSSSNFRFEWSWFRRSFGRGGSAETARRVLAELVADQECNRFLRDTFDAMYASGFEISPIHEHCRLEHRDKEFENILACAAADRLGAYSQHLFDASEDERRTVGDLFRALGPFQAFELLPGQSPGCQTCSEYNHHLFTNWFYGVAWDWCFVVLWEGSELTWVGLLTDTD